MSQRQWGRIGRAAGKPVHEQLRLAFYISLPVLASVLYGQPETMHSIVRTLSYITYPPEGPRPPVGEEISPFVAAERAAPPGSAAGGPSAATIAEMLDQTRSGR